MIMTSKRSRNMSESDLDSEFIQYRRKQIPTEMRPYHVGESLKGVELSAWTRKAIPPKEGDMIARNPNNHSHQWLVSAEDFADDFEEIYVFGG